VLSTPVNRCFLSLIYPYSYAILNKLPTPTPVAETLILFQVVLISLSSLKLSPPGGWS
jgi:uncharacterized membrane protein